MKIESTDDLLPGDLGFFTIAGRVGRWVTIGQSMIDVVASLRGDPGADLCWFTHAFLVLDDGECIEAMPGGARIERLAGRIGPGYGYVRLPLTDQQRLSIVQARELAGTPYSFLDYGYLAAKHAGLRANWLRRRVADSGHMICSQLADYALCHYADFHLFTDGRWHQDVTPGALFRKGGAVGESTWW